MGTWMQKGTDASGADYCPARNRQMWLRSRRAKNLIAGIWVIFRGFNFSRNADIGQIGHLWMANRLSSAAHKSNRHGRLTKSPPPAYGIGITFRISGTRPFAKNAPGG
jgi:hypothetical protein